MTDNTTKQRTITLTDRPPVRIREDQWPVIATGSYSDWDNQYEFQANRKWNIDIKVRQHQDGRVIVYSVYDYDTRFATEKSEAHRVGALLAPDDDLPAAIKRTAEQMIVRVTDDNMHRHIRAVADECIADLPAQEI